NSLANRITTWDALKIVNWTVRMTRSARFRDCFPPSYVRTWEEQYRTYLFRQHLAQLPYWGEELRRQAGKRLARVHAALSPISDRPFVGFPFRSFSGLRDRILSVWERWLTGAMTRRMRREERILYRRLDPGLRDAGVGRWLCETVPLPTRRFPP